MSLQGVCVLFTGGGIFIQYQTGANIGLLLITAGTFIFAISVKITKVRLIRLINTLLNNKLKENDKNTLDAGKNGLQNTIEAIGSEGSE